MIRVGIVGAGGMGNTHANKYELMPEVDLSVLEQDAGAKADFLKRHHAKPFDSYEDFLKAVDIVDICLPTDLHLEFGLKAIASGKAVFIEKPIAHSLADGVRLMEEADKAGVPLMPGQVVRFFPEFAQGKAIVESGRIGKPAAARTRRGGLSPARSENWFMDHSRSGGVLLDLGIHDFDWLRWTLGEVKHLYARSAGAKTGRGLDYALTTLTFDNGAVGHVEATWMDPGGGRTTYEIAGSGGLIQYDSRTANTLKTHASGKLIGEAPLDAMDDPYYLELRGFVNAVQGNLVPPVTAYDGVMALSISLAAIESAKTGKVIAPARQF
jgi:predicted dehydrogenase